MSYKYTHFDETLLPPYNTREDHSPAPADSPFIRTADGFYADLAANGKPLAQVIAHTGSFVGQEERLVDEDGDFLVDEDGDYLIAGDAKTMLHAQIRALREKNRQWGQLWRQRLSDDVREWKQAQFTMREPETHADLFSSELTCNFATKMLYWHAEDATSVSETLAAGETTYFFIENVGETVEDAVLTLAQVGGTITEFTITCETLGIDLTWTGSLGEAQTLTWDFGNAPAPTDAVDAYDGFEEGDNHTAQEWFPIALGMHLFSATVTGGTGALDISFYVQSP